MTHAEARMIAKELHKLIHNDIVEIIAQSTSEAFDRTLSVAEAAEYLGWKPKSIYNKIQDIPHFKSGRFLRFSESALKAFIRERKNLE